MMSIYTQSMVIRRRVEDLQHATRNFALFGVKNLLEHEDIKARLSFHVVSVLIKRKLNHLADRIVWKEDMFLGRRVDMPTNVS